MWSIDVNLRHPIRATSYEPPKRAYSNASVAVAVAMQHVECTLYILCFTRKTHAIICWWRPTKEQEKEAIRRKIGSERKKIVSPYEFTHITHGNGNAAQSIKQTARMNLFAVALGMNSHAKGIVRTHRSLFSFSSLFFLFFNKMDGYWGIRRWWNKKWKNCQKKK